MFSLQPTDELVFGASDDVIIPQSDNILDDLIVDSPFIQSTSSIIDFTSTSNQQQQALVGLQTAGPQQSQTRNKDVYGTSNSGVLRRDLERQRRQEMSHLHASLRALLPIEFVKGKRSISDHMQEATNYINHLKNNIQELQIRSEKLKECFYDRSSKEKRCSNDRRDNLQTVVNVNKVRNGLEILINSSNVDFALSKVLADLLVRDMNVVSCVSTKTKGRFLHRIQAEANDLESLDLVVLQERLSHICG